MGPVRSIIHKSFGGIVVGMSNTVSTGVFSEKRGVWLLSDASTTLESKSLLDPKFNPSLNPVVWMFSFDAIISENHTELSEQEIH